MNKPTYAFDSDGFYHNDAQFLIGGGSKYLVGVLNSPVCWWFLTKSCTDLQNGYLQALKANQLPIPIATASAEQQAAIETVVDYLLWLHRADAGTVSADALMTGYWEQVVNALVYELYFPDELRAHLAPTAPTAPTARDPAHRPILARVQAADLPAVTTWPGPRRTAELRALFQQLYDPNHPLRGTLFSLASLETVKLIEGRA